MAYAGYIPLSATVTGLIKYLDTMLIPLMVFFWFWFAEVRFRARTMSKMPLRILFALPVILMLILYLTSFKTGLVFRIEQNGLVEPGPMAALTGIIDNFYGIAIILHALVLIIREKDRFQRKEYWIQIFFILICTVGGIVDSIVSMTPVMTLAIAFSFVYLFVNLLEPQIYSDALTGLNNRRRADRYMTEKIAETSSANPFYLFMTDVDNFKQINDTKGHLEGDRALKAIADAIADATDDYHGFAARWGGDEFLAMIRKTDDGSFPGEFEALLAEKCRQMAVKYGIDYPLTMTVGYAVCNSAKERIPDLIAKADEMLYRNKARVSAA